jgi:hypothetical protein
MLEILLTRLFSVATWYYFAFFAISVAMFGLTVGALIVYIFADKFPDEKLTARLALFALIFAVTVFLALLTFLSIPFNPRFTGVGLFSTVFVFIMISVPFISAGVIFCICLTRYPKRVGYLYAADLIGASIGAFLVFPVLNAVDAPSAVFLVGVIASLAAIAFSFSDKQGLLYKVSSVVFIVLAFVMVLNSIYRPVRVEWVKGVYNQPETETWNTFSRIAVYPFKWVKKPYSWGLSSAYPQDHFIGQRMIDIDGVSETPMTLFRGDPKEAVHLKYDVTSIAHHLKDDAKVFVIGVGGGRDILAAKIFNQREVVGAEINNRILEMMAGRYGDFTGHLDKLPGVRLINGEARSVITRMDEKFDIIQASCIATWSATSAGAFSLAENSLYTVEGWNIFLDHLNDDGLLSFNRWYSPDFPAQLLRLASLASFTLRERGVKDPARHIALVRNSAETTRVPPNIIMINRIPSATILVSKSPFKEADMERLRSVAEQLEFTIEFDPLGPRNPLFAQVIENAGIESFHESAPLDLTPPTDDRPFFFFMLSLSDAFSGKHLKFQEQKFSLEGIVMLVSLLIVSVVLSIIFIILPLFIVRKRVPLPRGGALVALVFFASIGLGYILIEIGILQRLIIFLGHPIYSITVVLFSMLFSSGLGSISSSLILKGKSPGRGFILTTMSLLLVMILIVIKFQPAVLSANIQTSVAVRIMISLLFLFPLGFIMGMPFPVAMTLASKRFSGHTPWFWAINGATSVVASVLSACISITWGFTATLSVGFLAYLFASIFLYLLYSLYSSISVD